MNQNDNGLTLIASAYLQNLNGRVRKYVKQEGVPIDYTVSGNAKALIVNSPDTINWTTEYTNIEWVLGRRWIVTVWQYNNTVIENRAEAERVLIGTSGYQPTEDIAICEAFLNWKENLKPT